MSLRLVFHEAAYRKLDEAERYIEARRNGYGLKFRMAVGACLRFIADHPTGYAERRGGFRYAVVAKFPYRVIYKVYDDRVFIAAVYHGKRRPDGWAQRKP